jgi:hypothetical protein
MHEKSSDPRPVSIDKPRSTKAAAPAGLLILLLLFAVALN